MPSSIRSSASKICFLNTASLARVGAFPNIAKDTRGHALAKLALQLKRLSRHYFDLSVLSTLEAHCRKSLHTQTKQRIKKADLRHFRFHPSTRLLAKQGYYATAYQLSLLRTAKEAHLFPLRQTQLIPFSPQPSNVMVGMDKYGNQYIHSFNLAASEHHLYRITEGQPSKEPTLSNGIRRRIRHATPGGISIAQAFIHAPAKFEILLDHSNTVYLQQAAAELVALDKLDSPFRAANTSANGRFTGLITADGKVIRYDNQSRCSQTVDLNGDCEAITISVANNGTLYIGSRQHTYIAFMHKSAIKVGPALDQDNRVFSLSPDERFLISQSAKRSSKRSGKKVEILLTDRANEHRQIILSATSAASAHSKQPYSIAFSQLNALVAVGYQNGTIEIFDLTHLHQSYAQSLGHFTVPQYGCLPPCPLVSFAQGFDQVHVAYRGHASTIELGTLSLGAAT